MCRPTRAGREAQQVWRLLPDLIERRWRDRYGNTAVGELADALQTLTVQLDAGLPRYLPVVKNQLFEAASDVSLPICANLLRVLEATPQRIRDLPQLTGVSRESIAVSLGILEKGGHAVLEADPAAGRGKVARLTTKGLATQAGYHDRLRRIEAALPDRFGDGRVRDLRRGLERLVGEPGAASPLLDGLVPYPNSWRAFVPRPQTLPHHPMVLHRGGFPDGS